MALVNRRRRTALPAVLAVTAAALIAVAWPSPAFANEDIQINPGNLGTTAAGFENNNDCEDVFGGGPYTDSDVWVFNLPGDHDTVGDFVSVTASFDTDGNGSADTTKTITADQPSGIVLNGTSKAWIKLPAGWVLKAASAVITGTVTDPDKGFVLTHTCAASGSPSPSPTSSRSVPPSGSPSGSPSMSPSSSAPGTGTPSTSTSPSSPSLPVTGSSLTYVVLAGLVLVGGGAALTVMARRRRING